MSDKWRGEGSFECNLCGQKNTFDKEKNLNVPGQLCGSCNSSTRFRLVAYAVSKYIFNGNGILSDDIGNENGKVGIGLSDAWPIFKVLDQLSGYTNTFYHQQPELDIMSPSGDFTELGSGFITKT